MQLRSLVHPVTPTITGIKARCQDALMGEKKHPNPCRHQEPVQCAPSCPSTLMSHIHDISIQEKLSTSIAKDDEEAAMAAMFQMQSANWEETQEKMSQLVSRLADFFPYCSSPCLMNDRFCFTSAPALDTLIVLRVYILTIVVPASLVEVNRHHTSITTITTNLCRLAMSAIDVDRKVRCSHRCSRFSY